MFSFIPILWDCIIVRPIIIIIIVIISSRLVVVLIVVVAAAAPIGRIFLWKVGLLITSIAMLSDLYLSDVSKRYGRRHLCTC